MVQLEKKYIDFLTNLPIRDLNLFLHFVRIRYTKNDYRIASIMALVHHSYLLVKNSPASYDCLQFENFVTSVINMDLHNVYNKKNGSHKLSTLIQLLDLKTTTSRYFEPDRNFDVRNCIIDL